MSTSGSAGLNTAVGFLMVTVFTRFQFIHSTLTSKFHSGEGRYDQPAMTTSGNTKLATAAWVPGKGNGAVKLDVPPRSAE